MPYRQTTSDGTLLFIPGAHDLDLQIQGGALSFSPGYRYSTGVGGVLQSLLPAVGDSAAHIGGTAMLFLLLSEQATCERTRCERAYILHGRLDLRTAKTRAHE